MYVASPGIGVVVCGWIGQIQGHLIDGLGWVGGWVGAYPGWGSLLHDWVWGFWGRLDGDAWMVGGWVDRLLVTYRDGAGVGIGTDDSQTAAALGCLS